MPSEPLISVVIPHLNHPTTLARSLAALSNQTFEGTFEVIVVDNGSKTLPEDVVAKFPIARLESEATPGPGPARSHGARLSQGKILAFIDADCLADENWLKCIADYFEATPNCDTIGGEVGIAYVDPKKPTSIEAYEAIWGYRMKLYIERDNFTGTGNMAVRRDSFLAVGDFAGIETAEDMDWGKRAHAKGMVLHYVPDMRIKTPARESFSELTRKWDRHIGHDFELLEGAGGKLRWVFRSLALAISPILEIPRIIASDKVSGVKTRFLAFRCLLRIRLYRARRMLGLLLSGDGRSLSGAWNRPDL